MLCVLLDTYGCVKIDGLLFFLLKNGINSCLCHYFFVILRPILQ